MTDSHIREAVAESIRVKQQVLENTELLARVASATVLCTNSLHSGGRIWFCGNGGSAADAQHLAAELSGRFYIDRAPLAAEALHCNTSFLTAVANDFGYDEIYARALRASGRKGDVLVAISTSGNSANIVKACEAAQEMGISIVALTGASGGLLANLADICLAVPSTNTPRIQECHILLGHIICEAVEAECAKSESE